MARREAWQAVTRSIEGSEGEMRIFAEVTVDETGIIEQIDKVRNIGDKLDDEMLKLRDMLATGQARGVAVKESIAGGGKYPPQAL